HDAVFRQERRRPAPFSGPPGPRTFQWMNWLCDGHRQYSTARGGLTTATLAVSNGAKSIRIHAGTAAALLFTAHFRGHQPAVAVADGTVSLRFGAEPSAGDGRVALHPDVTWNIRVRNGANELQADLTNIRLASIDIEG